MRFHVIVNPAASSGSARKVWEKTEPLFMQSSNAYEVHFSSLDKGIEEIVKELTNTKEEVNLVVFGGDGSFNEAVNGIVNFEKTRLGIVPCGSGCDLIRDMKLPKKREVLIREILKGEVKRQSDIGILTYHNTSYRMDHTTHVIDPLKKEETISRRFNVSAGIGFDAHVCQQVFVSKWKPFLNRIHLGSLVYLIVALRLIFANQEYDADMLTDEHQTIAVPHCKFISFHNHAYEGGGFKFCPNADFNDGMLDICTAFHITPGIFFRLFVLAYSGKHIKYKEHIGQLRMKRVHIKSKEPVWVHTDGEVIAKSDSITIEIPNVKLNLLI